MSVDWAHFTPVSAMLGGALIGASAGLMALVGGKIAGVGGIFGTTLNKAIQGKRPQSWRLFFLAESFAPRSPGVCFARFREQLTGDRLE